MTKIFDQIYVKAILGLGDAITLKPLIAQKSSEYHCLFWPAIQSHWKTVCNIFADVPNVKVVVYESEEAEQQFILENSLPTMDLRGIVQRRFIHYNQGQGSSSVAVNYDRQIYEYFGVPYSTRYTAWSAKFDEDAAQRLCTELNPSGEPYLLWHNQISYALGGTPIDLETYRREAQLPPLKIIHVSERTDNLLDWSLMIAKAEEIHCVTSSFHALVDSLIPLTKAQLFYHDIRANALLQVNCNANNRRWRVVHYEKKI